MSCNSEDRVFMPIFRAACKGDPISYQTMVRYALHYLSRGEQPPPGLTRYLLKTALNTPERHAEMMAYKPPKRKGRQSIDDTARARYFTTRRSYFGQKPSQRNAMMVAYLVSENHPISETPSGEKESAAVLVSELTGRSVRSLQSDYYQYKDVITDSQVERGRLLYEAQLLIKEERAKRKSSSQ